MSFRIIKDTRRDTIRADESFVLPVKTSQNFPPNVIQSLGGGLIYDTITAIPYYNNGTQWLPLSGGGGSVVNSYALIKDTNQVILNATDTILVNLDSTPSPYHDETGSWNLATGIFTSAIQQSLMVAANITWAEDTSTVGRRYVQIIYKPVAGVSVVAKEAVTQPDPDVSIKTTQEATMIMKLEIGDQVWISVRQTSGVSIPISGGNETSLSGFRSF